MQPIHLFVSGRATFRSQAVLDSSCTLCGSFEDVEMHHVRALKDVSKQPKDFMSAMMSRMNRKQIPVCRPCHIRIHQGTITKADLKDRGDKS